jgi:hypothetical protein
VGYKKIQEKEQEFRAKSSVKARFAVATSEVEKGVKRLQKASEELASAKEFARGLIGGLDTGGVREFDEYKHGLVEFIEGKVAKAPSDEKVWLVVHAAESEVKAMVKEWQDQLAANCPAEVRPPMVFKDQPRSRIYEITKGPLQATNTNLKGDQAICFEADFWPIEGGQKSNSKVNMADLKKMKYLRL